MDLLLRICSKNTGVRVFKEIRKTTFFNPLPYIRSSAELMSCILQNVISNPLDAFIFISKGVSQFNKILVHARLACLMFFG